MSDLAIAAAEAQSPDDVESDAPGRTWNFDLIITPIAMGLLLILLITVWQFADMDVTTKKILSPANLRIQTWQHLQITFWSTLLVISIAIPLGIFITREGFKKFSGPILTVANWSGQWPGLVGMLNLNGSLTKAGVKYSTLWSEDFTDDYFRTKLRTWLTTGRCAHKTDHVQPLARIQLSASVRRTGEKLAAQLLREKAIMGIFDEGCMGMFNAIIPDDLLHRVGVFKERLSQSTLYAESCTVDDAEAAGVRAWMERRGMKFHTGPDEATDLTLSLIHISEPTRPY